MTTEPDRPHARLAERLFLQSGFVWQLCWSSYWTLFFVRVVVDVGLNPVQLVLLGTAKEVTILVVEIPTGVVADLRSRRLSVILAFFICGSAIVGAGLAPNFALLFLTQVLWAFGSTFRSGAEAAWFTGEVGSADAVDVVLPRRGRMEAIGSIVGLVSMSVLAALVGLSAALVITGSLLVGWGAALTVRMPETEFERRTGTVRDQFGALLRDGIDACRQPALRILVVAAVMAGFASEAIDRLHVARFDEIGLQAARIDPALLVGSATVMTSIGAFVILGVFASRLRGQGLATALTALHGGTAIGVILLARVDVLAIAMAGFISQGMMRNIARTATIGWTNHFTNSANRATVHSFVGQAGSFGEISGGIALGLVAHHAGLGNAMAISAATYLAAAAVVSRGRSRWTPHRHLRANLDPPTANAQLPDRPSSEANRDAP